MSFKAYHPAFEKLVGSTPAIELLLEKDYPFAHEAGIFFADTNELFVTSNRLFDGFGEQRVQISRVKLGDTQATMACEEIPCSEIAMANGGVNHRGGIIFCAQGNQTSPSGLYQTSTTPPYKAEVLVSDFYGHHYETNSFVVNMQTAASRCLEELHVEHLEYRDCMRDSLVMLRACCTKSWNARAAAPTTRNLTGGSC